MGPDSHSCAFFLPLFIVRAARPQRKLHYNFTPSGSKGRQIRALPTSSQPLVLQGMQVTCGLPDLMMSFHHQTEKKHRQPAAFLRQQPSIDRSIDLHGHRSSTPGPATSTCKSFWDYNAVWKVVYHSTLYSGCILNLAHGKLISLWL